MAPRLPVGMEVQLGSPAGWPLWLLCTSITLGLFSTVALFAYSRVQALEAERRRQDIETQQDKQTGHVEVIWTFPDKEDKAARFRRWAEVLRFKPREARLPIPTNIPRLDVEVALEVFFREAQAAGIGAATAPASPKAGKHQIITIGVDEAEALLREKVKERILLFLMECGPPKGLCAIREEDRSVPGTPQSVHWNEQQQQQHLIDVSKLDAPAPQLPSTPFKASPCPPPALVLDGEPVLCTESGEMVTRELLWAVLAKIHAEAAADVEETASAAIVDNSSTEDKIASAFKGHLEEPRTTKSNPSTLSGGALTQPLLGEWVNPLQAQESVR